MSTKQEKRVSFSDAESEEQSCGSDSQPGCGVLGRYPVLSVLAFAAAGIGLGLGLSYWEPEDPQDKDTAIKWVGLIGDMFIRALKAVVLPLVFVNVVLSVLDMMAAGRASAVGWKTIGLYMLTTLCASILGLISILSFKGLFEEGEPEGASQSRVQLACSTEDGSYLSHAADGSVACSANHTDGMSNYFIITDVDNTFETTSSGPQDDISMSDTIYDGVFTKLVTSNIFASFVEANFAAVVIFAIVFGAALARVLQKKHISESESVFVKFLKEVDDVLLTLINWVIMVTPFAVLSLIANAIGAQDNLKESFENVGYLVAATSVAMIGQVFLVYVGLFAAFTRSNPFNYLKHLLPAQTTAFACSSSAATIPVTLQSVKDTGKVPDSVAKFVIPMGATINMDGSAIYFPCACVWLAILNGITPQFGDYVLLCVLATIGSAGTAPVPSASLVLIITAYNTVFGTTGTPDGFSFILAIDWFMDRCRTVTNVTGDAVVAGLVAHGIANAEDDDSSFNGKNITDHEDTSNSPCVLPAYVEESHIVDI
ncbi:Putative sodium-dependent excitatory amino acid transporter glt [Seminavis robusta]|uniref:Amino acid transporter n=1 Tax=Seminavis robusta TaxID=568900 RepID=A0A9N8DRB7_9STRA|nr:Putative sodium-dependent excitatory amino acid transporter glt [Seminavis robusta]|eukprot:Sro296_g110640.1 Putative sodium-dependent excitatory amino acid transporter glt (541) ;mRNA; r:20285-22107